MLIIPGTFVYDEAKNEYIVEEFIGNGAFGNVYKIKRVNDETTWALKTIISNFSDEQNLIAFKNEINMAMKVNNSQVIKYIFAHDGSIYPELPPYIIMEYANNGTLKALIDKRRADKVHFNNEELKSLFFQLIAGMKAVNQVLVHRDIKPDNILLSNSEIKISDFGLSKVSVDRTRTITFKGIGHLKYYAPEAWMNDKNTTQMDIYSMGLVFYELATLKYPYKVMNEADVEQWRNAHLFSEPINPHTANPNISPVITGVIMKMLEKSTNSRFKS
ncbi:kinase domain protein, partial [Clostridiales bacterium oral taxon 876 str. F0540]